jgi:hypothetical protein
MGAARVSCGDGTIDSEYEATLEHFAGDMMIFFNDPVPVATPRSGRSA